MAVFIVPLYTTVHSSVLVRAESPEEALDKVYDAPFPAVEDGQYDEVEPWEIDHENVEVAE